MECNYSFLQSYHIIYDQPKEQDNVTFRILERGIKLSVWSYISFLFFIFSQFFFIVLDYMTSISNYITAFPEHMITYHH